MDLQTAFYIVGIVFMGVMLILVAILLTAVLVIKSKINRAQRAVEQKLHMVGELMAKGVGILRVVQHFAKR